MALLESGFAIPAASCLLACVANNRDLWAVAGERAEGRRAKYPQSTVDKPNGPVINESRLDVIGSSQEDTQQRRAQEPFCHIKFLRLCGESEGHATRTRHSIDDLETIGELNTITNICIVSWFNSVFVCVVFVLVAFALEQTRVVG